jgi:hypothetical protein
MMPRVPPRFQHGIVTEHLQPDPAAAESELSQDERAELERLRAETAELHHQMEAGPGRRRRFSWRTTLSIVLIVLGCVLAPVSVLGV